jgi:cytochrome b subunit of formate dehydrogenase
VRSLGYDPERIEHIFLTILFNMHPYFSGGIFFGIFNSLLYLTLLLFGKKIYCVWHLFKYFKLILIIRLC